MKRLKDDFYLSETEDMNEMYCQQNDNHLKNSINFNENLGNILRIFKQLRVLETGIGICL